jgi:hypothetical protein
VWKVQEQARAFLELVVAHQRSQVYWRVSIEANRGRDHQWLPMWWVQQEGWLVQENFDRWNTQCSHCAHAENCVQLWHVLEW